MKRKTKKRITKSVPALITLSLTTALFAASEEERLIKIAKNLKPISDAQWSEIAGSHITEKYELQKGDTLWDVSKKIFGTPNYWPKVWALNHGIQNPHVISPGNSLTFSPGTSETPATVSVTSPLPTASSEKTTAQTPIGNDSSSKEYLKIPADWWAPINPSGVAKEKYDEFGLDREIKVSVPIKFKFRIPAIANDTTVPFLGEIVGSRREGAGLAQNEVVFLKSNAQDLQVGATYSVLSEPEFVQERKSDRSGYIYNAVGEVKIIGVKDELYIATITTAYDVLKRGDRIYPLLPLVTEFKPIPSRTALEALALVSKSRSTRDVTQFSFLHFDRGIEDGVQIGNVFRVYEYYDPVTDKKLTDSDFIVSADAIVVHATAQFSTALVIRARGTVANGKFGVLLTDVSDLEKQLLDRSRGFGEQVEESNPDDRELDELDELDRMSGEGLGRKEEQEIKELDQWDREKNNPEKDDKSVNKDETIPSAVDTPSDDLDTPNEPPANIDRELDKNVTPPKNVPALPDQPAESPSLNAPSTENGSEPAPLDESAGEPQVEPALEPNQ